MQIRFAVVGIWLALGAGACVTTSPVVPPPVVVPPEPPAPPAPEPAPAPPVPEPPAAPVSTAEEGLASFYANRFEGRRTASGERYRRKLATCAHRTHPFGTILVVTVVDTGKSATCRVNDRGPWKQTRVLDVSKSVAKTLGMIGPGVVTVRVEVEQPAASPTSALKETPPPS